jgi:hypothetical protein
MTAESDERWVPVPEIDGCTFSAYRASTGGRVRSIDRTVGVRRVRGVVLKPTPNNRGGYLLISMSCDNPEPEHPKHKITVHKVILNTFAGPCPPGMEACHGPGGPADNRWPDSGLRWGSKPENDAERIEALRRAGRSGNGRAVPAPKIHRPCILCAAPVTHGGRRCHDCVVKIGQEAARLLATGMSLEEVAAQLDYPTANGVASLALRYGPPVRVPWTRRVTATLRGIFGRRRP